MPNQNPLPDTNWRFADIPSKTERADVARTAYFKHQKELGTTFALKEGIYYRRKGDGMIVGVTYSSRDELKGTWFLNLLENCFQEAVLLCQSGPRSIKSIHLPKAFIDRYGTQLSKTNEKQTDDAHAAGVKFTLSREGRRWLLKVPEPVGVVDVTDFVEPDELLCVWQNRFDISFY